MFLAKITNLFLSCESYKNLDRKNKLWYTYWK